MLEKKLKPSKASGSMISDGLMQVKLSILIVSLPPEGGPDLQDHALKYGCATSLSMTEALKLLAKPNT